MDIIIFNSLSWVSAFKEKLQKNYKKMFYPLNDEYKELWQIYVDNTYRAREIGLILPDETDYPLYIDYYISDTEEKKYSQFFREKQNEFYHMMQDTILTIDDFLNKREV